MTLHRRLFHVGQEAVALTPEHTKGVTLSDNPRRLGDPPDEACLHGKHCRTAKDGKFEHDTQVNAWDRKVPGGTISIDPHGPYPPSVRLNQYFLLATCDATGYQVGYSYDFPGMILRILKEVRRLMGKPDFWRLDRDSKLLRASSSTFTEFERWCSDEGMGIKSSSPENQWENGAAENAARRAYEHATAAMTDAGLPSKYWCFTVEAYCYVSNRTSRARKSGKTPYELHWGAVPYIDHLRVFGCPAWSAVTRDSRRLSDAQQKKLKLTGDVSTPVFTSRAQRSIFVGYPLNQKPGTYLLFRLSTGRLVSSRDVFFDEQFRLVERNRLKFEWRFLMDDPVSGRSHSGGDDPANVCQLGHMKVVEFVNDKPDSAKSFDPLESDVGTEEDEDEPPPLIPTEDDDSDDEDNGKPQVASARKSARAAVTEFTSEAELSEDDEAQQPEVADKPKRELKVRFAVGSKGAPAASREAQEAPKPTRVSRRSGRAIKPRERLVVGGSASTAQQAKPPPLTQHLEINYDRLGKPWRDATAGSDPKSLEEWKQSVRDEIDGVVDSKSVSEPMDKPAGQPAITSLLIYREKDDGRKKSRWCPRGCGQKDGYNYEEDAIYAPVVDKVSLRIVLAIAVALGLQLRQIDVVMAFLYAELLEVVYMYAPSGIDIGRDATGHPRVFQLLKSVYGLKQAPKNWYDRVTTFLSSLGFRRSRYDLCVYFAWRSSDCMFLAFHVDDFVIATSSGDWEDEFIKAFAKEFEIKDLGEPKLLLGMTVEYSRELRKLKLSCPITLRKLIKGAGFEDCNPSPAPLSEPKDADVVAADDDDVGGLDVASIVGSLNYAATVCRPDLAVPSSWCGSERHEPTVAGVMNLRKTLRYCKGSLTEGISVRHTKKSSVQVDATSDSDWGGDLRHRLKPTGKSRGGGLIRVAGFPVWWFTKLQTVVALSSAQAEVNALTSVCKRVLHVRRLVTELGFDQGPTPVGVDNEAALSIARSDTLTERTRHFALPELFCRECVASDEVQVYHKPGVENDADFFTKIHPTPKWRELKNKIMHNEL